MGASNGAFNPPRVVTDVLLGQSKPGRGRATADVTARVEFAREYMQAHPRAINAEVREALRARFGMGISQYALSELREQLGLRRKTRALWRSAVIGPPETETDRAAREFAATRRERLVAPLPIKVHALPASPPPPPSKFIAAARAAAVESQVAIALPSSPTADSIRSAIQLLLEEVPHLRKLSIEVIDGKPVVSFEVAQVSHGRIEL